MDVVEALLFPITVNTMNKSESIKCSASSFGGVDPNPFEEKQCFCAKENFYPSDTVEKIKDYWVQ
jgi:hypothetical protein